jgi:TetR/AcrR family transcriptional regulator, lmrAB and yxaGH operons repressor
VTSAAEMFRARGVHGTGVLAILDRARAPRGSLYHHFPGGKPELVVAALEFEASRVAGELAALIATDPGPEAAVMAFAEGLAVSLERSDYRLGCPIATAALEMASDDPSVRNVCALAYRTWQQMITAYLVSRSVADAGERAETALCTIEGALILARTHHDAEIVRRVARRVASSLAP